MPPKKDPKAKKPDDSAESKLQSRIAALEEANANLELQIAFLKEKLLKACDERSYHQHDAESVRASLATTKDDYIDILNYQTSQLKGNENRLIELQKEAKTLRTDMASKTKKINDLEETIRKNQEMLSECDSLLDDKQRLEQLVKSQQAIVEKQCEEIEKLLQKQDQAATENNNLLEKIDDLELRNKDNVELCIVFEDASLITTRTRRTLGQSPSDRCRSCLALTNGDKLVHLEASDGLLEAHSMDVSSLTWKTHRVDRFLFDPDLAFTSSSIGRSKLIFYGISADNTSRSVIAMLNTETMNWQSIDCRWTTEPKPRENASSCASRDRFFLFGGVVDEKLTNELWTLDMENLEWNQLIGHGDEPSARQGGSISISEDGRRLYLCGGYDGESCLNDVLCFEIEKGIWTLMTTHGTTPEPRQDHSSAVFSHYLIVGCGIADCTESDGWRCLGDLHVLDLTSCTWESIDSGGWISDYPWMNAESSYAVVNGNRLITIRPSRDGKLDHLSVTEILLPSQIEKMRLAQKTETRIQNTLEITNAICDSNSMEIEWIPPTKDVDRIDCYKLMFATSTGHVTSVYEGKQQRYRIHKLRPATEYFVCVKAVYDDGSFVWSDSRACRTQAI